MEEVKEKPPCGGCEEARKLGALGLLRGIIYGPAKVETVTQRLNICKQCDAKDSKKERLFRKIGDKIYCGNPKTSDLIKLKLFRAERADGCGCELGFKTSRKEAECPLGKWEAIKDPNAVSVKDSEENDIQVFLTGTRAAEALISACAIANLRKEYPKAYVTWNMNRALIPWAQMFSVAHEIIPHEFNKQFRHTFVLPEQAHKPETNRHMLYAGMCNNIKPEIPEMSIANYALEKIDNAHGFERDKTILLCPMAYGSNHTWFLRHWLELEEWLIDQKYGVVVFEHNANGNNIKDFRSFKYFGQNPDEMAAMVKKADLVLGVDPTMLHLAGVLQTKAIALCGPMSGFEDFSWYKTVEYIQGKTPCSPCFTDRNNAAYNRFCSYGCNALLYGIELDTVKKLVTSLMEK